VTGRQQLGIVVAVLTLFAGGALAVRHFLANEISPLGTGTKAPSFSATTLDTPARTKTLTDYKGQVVLLNVWATWCEPCRREMPSIEALQKSYGPKGLKIVAVSIDDAGTDAGIRAFTQQFGLTFEILHDATGAIQQSYQTTGVPESVLIGRDGIIRKKIAGGDNWNSSANRTLVEQLLAES
jgi:cytochrome c biogenesis protein CcmG/thiol:disulfide interchange protein DsbE